MSSETLGEKYQDLLARLRSFGSVAVAFSGGVDSALLLHVAREALGERAIAVTTQSRLFPRRELDEAIAFCRERDIPQVIVPTHELEDEAFRQNPSDRCYLCKMGLLQAVIDAANECGVETVVEGSNVDDEGDYRPGSRAIAELGVFSPLKDAGLTKRDIRELSRDRGLPIWDKPSFACLATRFAFGTCLSEEHLAMIDAAEQFLLDQGFHQVRVRYHGPMARVEVRADEVERLALPENTEAMERRFKEIGFERVSIDPDGYRTGNMNVASEDM